MNELFSAEAPSLAQEKPESVLRLIRSENVGPVTFFKLVSYFGSVEKALEGAAEMSIRGGRKRPIKITAQAEAAKELETVEKFGAQVIPFGAKDYPELLQTIHDPPPLLMCLGNPHIWQRGRNIGIVGARNASANGCRFAGQMATQLGQKGVTIISGLARGLDAAAHQGSLATGTVGVIAGGIDTVYPPENEKLYAQIREQGAIISEQPFASAPQPRNFPARNRIISGMSHGIVVVEASLKSGSLITARLAAEQGRDVFAVPGSPLDPRNKGSNQLIRDGAILTEGAEDVMGNLSPGPAAASEPAGDRFTPAPIKPPSENELAQARMLIMEKLGPDPVLVDELLAQCQLTASVVFTVLLEMELAGRLHRYPGNRVSLSV